MAQKHTIIPVTTNFLEGDAGLISKVWHQFLYKIFGDIYTRIVALETTSEDHETRITALEP